MIRATALGPGIVAALLLSGCPVLYHAPAGDAAVAQSADLATARDLAAVSEPIDLAVPSMAPGKDPCEGACAAGESCVAGCLPLPGACAGVSCRAGESCLDGACIPGCVVDRCAGINCPAGERCARDGRCLPATACDLQCLDGTSCVVLCLPPDACDGVLCDRGQSCLDGICVADPCAGLDCTQPTVCVGGACVDSCHQPPPGATDGGNGRCDALCSIGFGCVGGLCEIKRCQPGCSCLEDCVDGQCRQSCLAPSLPCACDCCPPSLMCGSDGHCHGMIH